MVLDMCKKCFSKLQTIVLIPTHGLQKKRIENSDGKLPGNGAQISKMHFGSRWTVGLDTLAAEGVGMEGDPHRAA